MAFEQVRLFEITGFDATGKPQISNTPIPFLTKGASEQEINNISITVQPEYSEKSYSADNKIEKNTIMKGANISFTFYGIDAQALDLLTCFKKDADGDLNLCANDGDETDVCVFYRAKEEKGKPYNAWLYDCEFKPINLDHGQDEDSPKSITIEGYAKLVTVNGKKTLGGLVYEGSPKYVAEGVEPQAEDLFVAKESTTESGGK